MRSCAKNETEPVLIAVKKAELISSSLEAPALISYKIALYEGIGASYSVFSSGGK